MAAVAEMLYQEGRISLIWDGRAQFILNHSQLSLRLTSTLSFSSCVCVLV